MTRPENYPQIRKSNSERVYKLLKKDPNMVPLGILVFDWKALDVTLQNLREIGKTHQFYVAKKKQKTDSLSFGCSRREAEQAWWSFTIYAADPSGFLSQLSHNIAMASQRGFSSIGCTFETKFEQVLDKVPWGSEEHEGMHLILFEKQVRG